MALRGGGRYSLYIATRNPESNMNTFQINQIVKGHVCGTFVILGFRIIGNQECAQLKEIHPVTHEWARGELCLPLDCIKAAA
jgi:hypothetical protein